MLGHLDPDRFDDLLPVGMYTGAMYDNHALCGWFLGLGKDRQELMLPCFQPHGFTIKNRVDSLIRPTLFFSKI